MRLRFNLGAIVEIILFGEEKSKTVTGKVVSVMDDEVQLCPQLRVKREREVSDWHFSEDPDYSDEISVDTKEVIHLNRQLIKSWKYVHINELNKKGAVNEEKDMITGKGIEDFTQNEFDPETGLCLGNGEYCGNIKEHYEMPIVIAVKQSEEDEEKDQRK